MLSFLVSCCLFPALLQAQGNIPGIPEPGLVMYGTVTNANGNMPILQGNVQWLVTGGGSTASVNSMIAVVNGEYFYVTRISFETRSVGGQTLGASANTLPLTSPATTFTRSASVFGTNAVIAPPATTAFTFGKTDRGKTERVDLQVSVAFDLNEDTDRDGMPNWAELVAGTDPNDPNSVFKLSSTVEPSPQGGLTITWASVPGKSYVVSRSEALESGFVVLGSPISSAGTSTTYTDLAATGLGPYFYRIQVNP